MNLKSLFFVCALFYTIQNSSAQTTEIRYFSSFNKIDLKGNAKVILTEGDKEEAKIEVKNLDLKDVITEVKNNTLYIYQKDKKYSDNSTLNIYISYQKLEGIYIGGVIDLLTNSVILSDKLELKCSGVGKVVMKIDTKELFVSSSGSGKLAVSGKTNYQSIEISGSGKFKGYELQSNTSKVNISGVGDVELNVTQELSANISGMGNITYKGNPPIKKINNNNHGSIRAKD
jgi:lipopolysaccharide export system protein LptA